MSSRIQNLKTPETDLQAVFVVSFLICKASWWCLVKTSWCMIGVAQYALTLGMLARNLYGALRPIAPERNDNVKGIEYCRYCGSQSGRRAIGCTSH